MSHEATLRLSPLNRILRSFAGVALPAEKLKVVRVVGPALSDCDDVVNLQFPLAQASGTPILLLAVESDNIGYAVTSSVPSQEFSAPVSLDSPTKGMFFGIPLLPALYGIQRFASVVQAPLLCILISLVAILFVPVSISGLDSVWMLFAGFFSVLLTAAGIVFFPILGYLVVVFFVGRICMIAPRKRTRSADRSALDAVTVGDVPIRSVTVATFDAGRKSFCAGGPRDGLSGMIWFPFAIGRSVHSVAFKTLAGGRESRGKVPVLTGLFGVIGFFSSKFGGQSFWGHRVPSHLAGVQ